MRQMTKLFRGSTFLAPPSKFIYQKHHLHSLRDYKAIGFDMDHCLVRNVTKETVPLLGNCLYNFLTKYRNYPQSIYEYGTFERNYFQNGLVIDLKTGNILKLGRDKMILKGYFGFNELSQDTIRATYGEPPYFKQFDEDEMLTRQYYCCLTFFECYFPLVFAKMTEIVKGRKNYLDSHEILKIMADTSSAVDVNYSHYNQDTYTSVQEFGDYYRTILGDKKRYLYKHDKMAQALKTLKDQGKTTFLITDSHYEFADLLMSFSYGDSWRELFDFIIVNGHKKSFFHPGERLFREISLTAKNRLGVHAHKLNKHQMYTEGNVGLLEMNINELTRNPQGRILYIGDNYSHDVLLCKRMLNWDAVCVMEELGDLDLGPDYDGRIWGDWKYNDTPYGPVPTFWYNEMMDKANRCVSGADSDEMIKFYTGHESLEEAIRDDNISAAAAAF